MKCFKCLGFGHIAANCPTKSIKLATKEQIQIKTKNENEKVKESKKGLILLDLPKIIVPSRYTSSFSFSFPKVSTYLPSFLKNFGDDFLTPPNGFHLLRGFSSQRFFIPKHSFKTWCVNRTPSYALPTLKEHKLSSHPNPCTILYVNELTMLFAEVLNSRSNSLEHGGHDTTQVATKMTKEAKDKAHMNNHLNENFITPPRITWTSPEELSINHHTNYSSFGLIRYKYVVNNLDSL